MYEDRFSTWKQWSERDLYPRFPGIYIIALSIDDLSNTRFSWRPEIIYVGMTNAVGGLAGRLRQFDNTIKGRAGHGGADRVRYKYPDYEKLSERLYIATAAFDCDVRSEKSADLRTMGEVAKFENECFAHFVELFETLPEFNRKKDSPKYSLTVGREGHGTD